MQEDGFIVMLNCKLSAIIGIDDETIVGAYSNVSAFHWFDSQLGI